MTYWMFASRSFRCDLALDRAITAGIGSSCPSSGFLATIDQVYVASGEIVARLDRIGNAALLPYDHQIGHLYRESKVANYQQDRLVEITRLMDDIGGLFDEIHAHGEAHGHYLDVRLP